jgi:hypothetical protein
MFKILPIYPIFILLLIISSNYLADLFPCRLRNILENNIYVKHLFGYLTLLFFISITLDDIGTSVNELIKNSFVLYLYFVLLTKNNKYFFISICIVLAIIYLAHIELKLLKKKENKNENEKLFLDIYEKRKNKFGLDTILHYVILILLALGTLTYMGEKKIEYKDKFDYLTFFLGKQVCKGKSPDVDISKALKNALN